MSYIVARFLCVVNVCIQYDMIIIVIILSILTFEGVGVFSPLTADDARFPVDDNSLLSYKPSTVSYGNNNDIAISNSGIAPNRISAHSRKDRADKLQVNQILMSKSDINWTPGDKFLDLSEPAESQIDKVYFFLEIFLMI